MKVFLARLVSYEDTITIGVFYTFNEALDAIRTAIREDTDVHEYSLGHVVEMEAGKRYSINTLQDLWIAGTTVRV